jgi:hypothetical protein
VGETCRRLDVDSLVVGPAMAQHANHVGEPIGLDSMTPCRDDARDSAHVG